MPIASQRRLNTRGDHIVVQGVYNDHDEEAQKPTSDRRRDNAFEIEKKDAQASLASPFTITTVIPVVDPPATGPLPFRPLMMPNDALDTTTAIAANNPSHTVVVVFTPPAMMQEKGNGRISLTTDRMLTAAGSIGATIIIGMLVWAIYMMRSRRLTFRDLMSKARGRKPRDGSRGSRDGKQNYASERGNPDFPPPPRAKTRSGSTSSQTPLQPLARSDSFGIKPVERNDFSRGFYDDSDSHQTPKQRSATPSSLVLPTATQRQTATIRNTISIDGSPVHATSTDTLTTPLATPAPPVAPSFRQFLSNRPSASQRPGFGGPMNSRFSWTNSQAPQTPRDTSRDTLPHPEPRASIMTTRSSVSRFRTVDSWVNQQSNRMEAQRLKDQFRMTQTTMYKGEYDEVPKMPVLPKTLQEQSGLAGKEIRHKRRKSLDSVSTATVFKAHPGSEVRFSIQSAVPSEVLDQGLKNMALEKVMTS